MVACKKNEPTPMKKVTRNFYNLQSGILLNYFKQEEINFVGTNKQKNV